MEFDRLPSRPVVKSTLSAQADWDRWLYENHFQRLLDGDGLDWTLDLQLEQFPSDKDRSSSRWLATLQLGADVDVATFLKTGTLDEKADERLISLIGDQLVPLRMRPVTHEAQGEKEARDMMVRILPELRENIAKSKLRDIKRGLIYRWIESQAVFGAKESKRNW